MRSTVSLLVGSGFSMPEGLPGVNQLNQRLSKINESEILIHSDQTAIFLNGQKDTNRWARWDERKFLQEFLEFYNEEVLNETEKFHYETFYDYYSSYLTRKENAGAIESFCKRFHEKHLRNSKIRRDCYNRLADFNRTYNQLLASQLHRLQYFKDISVANHPPYDSFMGFLRELLKTSDVKFHTLNHDLFFDWLCQHHTDFWRYFADGFQLEGSPFYGKVSYDFRSGTPNAVYKTYYVKLEQFVNKFDKELCLFKLHGSIFNTLLYKSFPNQQIIRIKNSYAVSEFFEEIQEPKTGKFKFDLLHDETSPDFLSGTTNKTRYYTGDPYYANLFNHFEKNLSNSELLVVIGYGFQDPGINDYLERYYLSKGKRMIVLDPFKPSTNLIDKYDATYIRKGVSDLSYEEYLQLIPEEFNPSNK